METPDQEDQPLVEENDEMVESQIEEQPETETTPPEDIDSAETGVVEEDPAAIQDLDVTEAEELDEAEPAAEDDGRAWYVVHCYSGYENKVRHNLEQRIDSMGMKDRIFDVVVPTEEEIEVREGKRRTVATSWSTC